MQTNDMEGLKVMRCMTLLWHQENPDNIDRGLVMTRDESAKGEVERGRKAKDHRGPAVHCEEGEVDSRQIIGSHESVFVNEKDRGETEPRQEDCPEPRKRSHQRQCQDHHDVKKR